MDFLDKLVLPQSLDHSALLHYLATLILFLFVPFLSIVLGGSILSLYYKSKGKRDEKSAKFSEEIIKSATFTKGAGVGLGILPLLALILVYAQILHNLKLVTLSFFVVALVLITIGLIFIYTYRYSSTFSSFFTSVSKEKLSGYEELQSNISKIYGKSGRWGVIFLLIGTYFFVGGLNLASNPTDWDASGVLYLLSSFTTLIKWLHFLSISLTLSGAFVLFIYFFWEGGKKIDDEEYGEFVKKSGLTVTLLFALFQPIFLLLNINFLAPVALSTSVFLYAFLSLLLLFWVFHLLYGMLKKSNVKYVGMIFMLLIVSSLALIYSDQAGFRNVTVKQAMTLGTEYDASMASLKGVSSVAQISGEEIFKGRCSACHRFDVKLVGPPYKETLPKYNGDVEKVAAFVLNPVKKNPGYPPMPNQGLKPAEARAIAKYILEEVKKY